MNRIVNLFSSKKSEILSVFYTAGFPHLDSTIEIAKQLEKSGVDMLEIGIPYSDPIADGETIQKSSEKALENGMTLKILMQQLHSLREEVSIPILLMGYINPIIQYGVEKFCRDASALGIDGIILPDMPILEYDRKYKSIFDECNLSNIFLVTPQTAEQRILQIDKLSNGFIYLLSSNATTGKQLEESSELLEYYNRVKALKLQNPTLIGFGISNKETYTSACKHANGAIIGSAFIRFLEQNSIKEIQTWVNSIR